MALCGRKNIGLIKETTKVSSVHISENENLQYDLNFCDSIKNILDVIRLWRMGKQILEKKITVFKSVPISKIVH